MKERLSQWQTSAVAFTLVALLIAGCAGSVTPSEPEPLRWTVSGLSSGGYMAVQLHVAQSEVISGVGVIAAGPYDCANGNLQQALTTCLNGTGINPRDSTELVAAREATDDIDPTGNLSRHPVWLFHGAADDVVAEPVTQALFDFYASLATSESGTGHIKWVHHLDAAHGMPTLTQGVDCNLRASPFLNNCGYDAAGELLSHLHPLTGPRKAADLDQLATFDQSCCASPEAALAPGGYVFVPDQCRDSACDVHIVLHGCQQGEAFVQRQFVEQAGYLEWAQANPLILVFPQVTASALNPAGCWDWWGYTGADYAIQSGEQIQALIGMFKHFSTVQER